MLSTTATINTAHEGMIHDAQLDHYGRRLATASSDGTVKLFDTHSQAHHRLVKELRGHDGPVWEVAWAHPKFGNLLASCSFDKKVIIWKETATGWDNVHEHTIHASSVNSIAWAPHECGQLVLACGSSDGAISILAFKDGQWSSFQHTDAHKGGVTSVSFAPLLSATAVTEDVDLSSLRLVSGGCDRKVQVWDVTLDTSKLQASTQQIEGASSQPAHSDWVRDVAWAPALGIVGSMIATCAQNGEVFVWTQKKPADRWECSKLCDKGAAAWRLSWNVTGNVLAVSTADNKVTLWKQSLTGEWQQVASNPMQA